MNLGFKIDLGSHQEKTDSEKEDSLDLSILFEDDCDQIDIEKLPQKIWMKILAYLSTPCLCKMALISKHISSLALSPKFWSTSLAKDFKMNIQVFGLDTFLHIERFSRITSLDLACILLSKEELTALFDQIISSKFPDLQSLSLRLVPLSFVDDATLSKGVARVASVNISYSLASTGQCISLFQTISQQTALKEISLAGVFLRDVPGDIMGPAVAKLEKVILADSFLHHSQLTSILQSCLQPSSLTKVLILGRITKFSSSKLLDKLEEKLDELSYYVLPDKSKS